MTAGRKPTTTPDVIDVEAENDQQHIAGAMTVMRQDAQAEQQENIDGVFALGRMLGAAQMAGSIASISAVAEIRAFDEVNKSKSFKHLKINVDGEFRQAENIDEFCRAVFGGRGYKAMMDRRATLQRLGDDMFEGVNRLGLNRSQLRLLINLPEDTRSVVEEAMQAGSKSDVVTLIQSLANQLDEARAKADELKADAVAKEAVSANKSKIIDDLRAREFGFQRLPHDEQVDALLAEATNLTNAALTAISGRLRQALVALENHGQSTSGVKDFRPLAAGLVGQIQQAVTILRDEFMLSDIIGDGVPEWMRATAHLVDE